MKWHRLSEKEIFEITGSGPEGLSISDAEDKILEFGYNQLEEAKKTFEEKNKKKIISEARPKMSTPLTFSR